MEAAKWKSKQINNYDSLEESFAKDQATWQGAETTKEKCKCWTNETNGIQIESFIDVDHLLSQNEITLESFETTNTVKL